MSNRNLILNYLNYDSDKDYNGARGIAITEAVLQRNGYDFERAKKWVVTNGLAMMVSQNQKLLRIKLESRV